MSDNVVIIVLIVCLTCLFTTCTVTTDWRSVEQQKIQLEREKAGLK